MKLIKHNCNINTICQEIRDEISDAVYSIMREDWGIPQSEITNYYSIDIDTDAENVIRIELRIEADFDECLQISNIIDPIVSVYDDDAYFDMVEPGILEAYINIK